MTNPAKPIKGKTKIKRLILVLIGVILCVVAVTQLPLYSRDAEGTVISLPMPDYMTDLRSRCFSISQEPFWRRGVDGNDLSDYILENLHVYRNGELLMCGAWQQCEPAVTLMRLYVRDTQGNLLGHHGSGITYCLSSSLIKDKLTRFRLEIIDLDGKLLSFHWFVLRG
jgi:hypothetical protein